MTTKGSPVPSGAAAECCQQPRGPTEDAVYLVYGPGSEARGGTKGFLSLTFVRTSVRIDNDKLINYQAMDGENRLICSLAKGRTLVRGDGRR